MRLAQLHRYWFFVLNSFSSKPIFIYDSRCRGGNFVYSDDEIQIMLDDIRLLKANGADGFVLGALDESRNVDLKKCKTLIDECLPFPVTFHRAFDEVDDPMRNFATIVQLGEPQKRIQDFLGYFYAVFSLF